MSAVNNILVNTDYFCDYIPLVSSLTNLVDLFQKCVVLPLMDKSEIASNHYYNYLDQKSFFRCFVLVIPVVGNIIVGIYDFSKKKRDDNVEITVDDVEKIEVDSGCEHSSPCLHRSVIVLKDGRKAFGFDGYDICSIVSNISEERINPGKKWNAEDVKKHFSKYSMPRPDRGWEPKSVEKVLNSLFQ